MHYDNPGNIVGMISYWLVFKKKKKKKKKKKRKKYKIE